MLVLTRVTEIEASNSNPSLDAFALQSSELGVKLDIPSITRSDSIRARVELGKGEVKMRQAGQIDLTGRDAIADTVSGIGCLVVADGTATR